LRLPFDRETLRAAAAKVVAAQPPPVTTRMAPDGTLLVTASPHPDAAGLWLAFRSSAPITGVTLDGRPTDLSPQPGGWARVIWSGSDGFVLGLRGPLPKRTEIVAGELFDRWLDPRPLGEVPPTEQLWDLAGSSLVIGRVANPVPLKPVPLGRAG
jgi:hypothetical protein